MNLHNSFLKKIHIKQIACVLMLLCSTNNQIFTQEQSITPNYIGVELRSVIEAVSSITGKNDII